MNDILLTIAENKRREVEALYDSLLSVLPKGPESLCHYPVASLSKSISQTPGGIIAEFKRRSPSKGDIAPMADVANVVDDYCQNGAAACSVLTDTRFFGGGPADLALARSIAKGLPLLRKDFIVSKIQIEEARALGASAILLIAAILSSDELSAFNDLAHKCHMEALVEIHDVKELDKLSFMPDLLGVNNRNLASFHTDLQHSFSLIDALPKECLLVAESGIKTSDDIKRLRDVGFSGFLIGEAFMSTPNPGLTLSKFLQNL